MPSHNVTDFKFQSGTNSCDTAQSATSFPFQSSQSSNSIPKASANGFEYEIPSDFNFFSDASSLSQQNIESGPSADFSLLDNPIFNSSSRVYSNGAGSDAVLQQLLGEIIALNGDSDLSGATSHAHPSEVNSLAIVVCLLIHQCHFKVC